MSSIIGIQAREILRTREQMNQVAAKAAPILDGDVMELAFSMPGATVRLFGDKTSFTEARMSRDELRELTRAMQQRNLQELGEVVAVERAPISFTVDLARKDLVLALEQAKRTGAPYGQLERSLQLMEALVEKGFGSEDMGYVVAASRNARPTG